MPDIYNYDLTVEQDAQYDLDVQADDYVLGLNEAINVIGRGTYIHRQQTAASVWRIPHNLHCYPSVTVVDSADSKVTGDVDYIDDCTLTVSFVAPFSGSAYLN